jgi:hypothetical protein
MAKGSGCQEHIESRALAWDIGRVSLGKELDKAQTAKPTFKSGMRTWTRMNECVHGTGRPVLIRGVQL